MARTTAPTINLVMIKTKTNNAGEHPIVVRIQWKGRREKSTSVWLKEANWNEKTQRVVKRKDANSINLELFQIINEYQTRCKSLIDSGLPFKIDDILSKSSTNTLIFVHNILNYKDLMDKYINEHHLAPSTCRLHNSSYNALCSYGIVSIDKMDGAYFRSFGEYLKNKRGLKDGSIIQIMAYIGTVLRWGIDEELVDGSYKYPFKKFKFWKKYNDSVQKLGASEKLVIAMINDVVTMATERPDEFKRLLLCKRRSELFAEVMCLLCYHMQGIAFVDLCNIKVSDVKQVEVKGVSYYVMSGLKRQKTKVGIGYIVVNRNEFVDAVFPLLIESADERNGYFVPVLGDKVYADEAKRMYKINYVSQSINIALRKAILRLGFVDEVEVTYYSFRHSFASSFIKAGGNPVDLARMMGRSPNGIFRYVDELQSMERVIEQKKKIDILNTKDDWMIKDWLNTL